MPQEQHNEIPTFTPLEQKAMNAMAGGPRLTQAEIHAVKRIWIRKLNKAEVAELMERLLNPQK